MSSIYTVQDKIIRFLIGFGGEFSDEIMRILNTVEEIQFCFDFNCQITKKLPNNIKKIYFGWYFNQELINLPDELEHLKLGNHFNKNVDNLPKSLKTLEILGDFNHPVNNLPLGLKRIVFGEHFNQPLDCLPYGVEYIGFKMKSIFSYPLDNLPNSIIKLEIPMLYPHTLNNLPDSIEELYVGVKTGQNYGKPSRYVIIEDFDEPTIIDSQVRGLYDKTIEKIPVNIKKLFIFRGYIYIEELQRELGNKLFII